MQPLPKTCIIFTVTYNIIRKVEWLDSFVLLRAGAVHNIFNDPRSQVAHLGVKVDTFTIGQHL